MAPDNSTHSQNEDFPWTIAVVDHPPRVETALYRRSRALMQTLVGTLGDGWTFAASSYEDHHGGGLWVLDDIGWICLQSQLGIEWSAQFCADPARLEKERLITQRIMGAFPLTLTEYAALGYSDAAPILDTQIQTPNDVSRWTDSIFNASVPLPTLTHSGVLPHGAGYHHYPKPIVDINHFRFDDFQLFVIGKDGLPVVVLPVAPRGSGDGRVRVIAAHPSSQYMPRLLETTDDAELRTTTLSETAPASDGDDIEVVAARGARLGTAVLPSNDWLAQQAFARQQS